MKKYIGTGDDEREHFIRICDNPQCGKELTFRLPAMKKRFGSDKRIHVGVTTLSVTVRAYNGQDMRFSGEWCHNCADAGMAVLMDKAQEERSLLGAGTKKVD